MIAFASIIISCDAEGAKLYTVKVDFDNGKDKTLEIPVTGGGEYKITDVVPTKDGYEFDYWLCGENHYKPGDTIVVNSDLTIKAVWKEKTTPTQEEITVTFIYGEKKAEQKVKKGEKIENPLSLFPLEEGYTIEWYLGENKFDFSNTPINESITLKGTKKIKEFTVTFKDGESIVDTKTVSYGSKVSEIKLPSKEGYNFDGWIIGDKKFDIANETVKSDLVLTAKWIANNKVSITVVYNNGIEDKREELDRESEYTLPSAPTKEGYDFVNWDINGKTYNQGEKIKVSESITVTANWQVKKVTVSFDTAGGSTLESLTIDWGTTLDGTKLTTTKAGCELDYWEKDGTKFDLSTPIKGDVTLTAKWKAKLCYVIFKDGNDKLDTVIVEYNDKIAEAETPTKEGYLFSKWLKDGEEFDLSTPITEDITLYANWDIKKVTVTFNTLKDNIKVDSQTVNWGTTVTEPSIIKEEGDEKFIGWMLNGEMYSFSTPLKEDVTLDAKWVNKNHRTFIFDYQDGGITPSCIIEKTEGDSTISPPSPVETIEGKKMTGWLGSDGNTYSLYGNYNVTESMTFNAIWETKKISVWFRVNNNGESIEKEINWGTTVEKPLDPTREGSTFKYWYYWDNNKLQNVEFDFSTPIKEDNFSLSAMWDPEYYKVSFDPDNGEKIQERNYVSWGSSVQPIADPKKNGYKFVGWYDTATTEECKFPLSVKKDYTLKAKWEPDGTAVEGKCVVTLNYNDPSLSNDTITLDKGSEFNIYQYYSSGNKDQKHPDGKTLDCWKDESGKEYRWEDKTTIDEDKTFFAVWKTQEFNVFFYIDENGGSDTYQSVKWGEKLNKPKDPSKDGYTFSGWTAQLGTNIPFDFNTEIKDWLNLYAIWKPNKLSVTFNNGYSKSEIIEVDYGTIIRRQTPERSGYRFLGWYVDGGNEKYDLSEPITKEMTLVAKWEETDYYTVYFKYLDGKNNEKRYVKSGNSISSVTPEADGLVFEAWYKGDSTFDPYIFASEPFDFSTPIDGDTYLYAKFNIADMDNGEWFVNYNGERGYTEIPLKLLYSNGSSQVQCDISGEGDYSNCGTWNYDKFDGEISVSSTGVVGLMSAGNPSYEMNNIGEIDELLIGAIGNKKKFELKSERNPIKDNVIGTWRATIDNVEYIVEFDSTMQANVSLKMHSKSDNSKVVSQTTLKAEYNYYDYYGKRVAFYDPSGSYTNFDNINADAEYSGTLTYALDANNLIVYGFLSYDETKLIRK